MAPPPGQDRLRSFVHQLNNLLGGIYNCVDLAKRAKDKEELDEALKMIEETISRAQFTVTAMRGELDGTTPTGVPGSAARAAAAQRERKAQESAPAVSRILVVEDEELNRQLLIRLLGTLDHVELRAAADGNEAVRLAEQYAPDFVILDLALPGLSGEPLLRELHKRRPELKVLVLSGFIDAGHPVVQHPAVVSFLQKPIEPRRLIELVREQLGR